MVLLLYSSQTIQYVFSDDESAAAAVAHSQASGSAIVAYCPNVGSSKRREGSGWIPRISRGDVGHLRGEACPSAQSASYAVAAHKSSPNPATRPYCSSSNPFHFHYADSFSTFARDARSAPNPTDDSFSDG